MAAQLISASNAQKKVPMSTQASLYDDVCRALIAMLGADGAARQADLSPSTPLESLGMDSMKYINLLLSLEDIIGKELDEVAEHIELAEITTVGRLVDLVERLRDL
ncbi:acyl carrier protein [Actinomadura sp. KC216]|uniref:acyl carrier protein n=1 Tax=Actinomadura sp. KC216 TaxID=2530370 RepID=UPI0010485919|nr:phosphopantetheine-binding protein [Actinomadura sp. KC216]TDB84789.1 acyl carrier protein [Actinomadura sp. KC216]